MTFIARDGQAVPDIHTWRKHVLATQAQAFANIFKLNLAAYLSSARGFNMNEFFWKIGADPQKAPWRDVVVQKYGVEGLAFMDALLETLERPQKMSPDAARAARKRPEVPETPRAITMQNGSKISLASAFTEEPVQPYVGATPVGFGSLFSEPEGAAQEEQAQDEQPQTGGGFASLFS